MSVALKLNAEEWDLRCNLAAAYRLCAQFQMDDLTYTHLSARLREEEAFLIYPFGLLFEEVTASSLLKVSFEGKVLAGEEAQYNQTGYVIHGSIYKKRADVNAIFHLHTTAGVAVSCLEEGLLPLSQFSLHFYNRMAYHDYDSLALDYQSQGEKLAEDLGGHYAMILRNHGTLTCGSTIQEAFLYMHFLEQACKVQCAALAMNHSLSPLAENLCEKAAQDLRSFEPEFGNRDWNALLRRLNNTDPSFKF